MVFGLFDDRESRLQGERERHEELIAKELEHLQLDHELERQTMTQKGLIARQHRLAKYREEQKNASPPRSRGGGLSDAPMKRPPRPGPITHHLNMARRGFDKLVTSIIRPPRAVYQERNLGAKSFNFLGKQFVREDFTLVTERGFGIKCSHWMQNVDVEEQHSVVIYLHGNASARMECFQQLSYMLSLGTSVLSFDFAGSGLSDGAYVSLGYYEREDLATVIAHLRATMGNDVRICLWGRSMGAVTALMYASREAELRTQNVSCMVLDSSFSSLPELAMDVVDKARDRGIDVPNVVGSAALTAIGWTVQSKANFPIREISPISHAPNIDIPALFISGKQDNFIKTKHSQRIMEHYKGPKELLEVEGDHMAPRPQLAYDEATKLLTKYLLKDKAPDCMLEVPEGLNLLNAPWDHRKTPEIYKSNTARLLRASSSLSNTFDLTTLGMTDEVQHDIVHSLETMFGHDEEEDKQDDE